MSMLSGTTLSAIRALLYLGCGEAGAVIPPKKIAVDLGESPTYLSKVTAQLVKAGILHSQKGVKGGVRMAMPPAQITLLQIVEACQGPFCGRLCQVPCGNQRVCSFHRAATQIERGTTDLLSSWTLERLLDYPQRRKMLRGGYVCLMSGPIDPREGGRRVIP